ncbi:hypothetical protein Pmar_PMAR014915, partial [Perkinsus marinus ATCC 50983]
QSTLHTWHCQMDLANEFGWTPLLAAVFHGHVRVIELLLKAGASINCNVLLLPTPFTIEI